MAWCIVTSDMIASVRAKQEDVDGFTDFIRSIKGVEIAFMIHEVSATVLRINFRSSGKYIINDIAKSIGGGGHYYAAGARITNMNIEQTEKMLIEKLNNKLESRGCRQTLM